MVKILAVALGGALGSVLRYWMSTSVQAAMQNRIGINFPIGTLTVNAVGSLLIGLAFMIIQSRFSGNELLKGLVIVGLLGGFTTFSAFSFETLGLLQTELWGKALLNIIFSVLLCLVAALAGMELGRWALSN